MSGPEVTGPSPNHAGLTAQGMVGVSPPGGVTSFVWLLNDVSVGTNPASHKYSTVPAGPITVNCPPAVPLRQVTPALLSGGIPPPALSWRD